MVAVPRQVPPRSAMGAPHFRGGGRVQVSGWVALGGWRAGSHAQFVPPMPAAARAQISPLPAQRIVLGTWWACHATAAPSANGSAACQVKLPAGRLLACAPTDCCGSPTCCSSRCAGLGAWRGCATLLGCPAGAGRSIRALPRGAHPAARHACPQGPLVSSAHRTAHRCHGVCGDALPRAVQRHGCLGFCAAGAPVTLSLFEASTEVSRLAAQVHSRCCSGCFPLAQTGRMGAAGLVQQAADVWCTALSACRSHCCAHT